MNVTETFISFDRVLWAKLCMVWKIMYSFDCVVLKKKIGCEKGKFESGKQTSGDPIHLYLPLTHLNKCRQSGFIILWNETNLRAPQGQAFTSLLIDYERVGFLPTLAWMDIIYREIVENLRFNTAYITNLFETQAAAVRLIAV